MEYLIGLLTSERGKPLNKKKSHHPGNVDDLPLLLLLFDFQAKFLTILAASLTKNDSANHLFTSSAIHFDCS